MQHVIILHPAELQLKGSNRPFFERALMRDVQARLQPQGAWEVIKGAGKFVIRSKTSLRPRWPSGEATLPLAPRNDVVELLQKIPGIANICPAFEVGDNVEEMKRAAVALFASAEADATFKVEATRSDKSFGLTSLEICRTLGAVIAQEKKLRVDVHHPAVTLYVAVDKGAAYLYTQKSEGMGGLPLGTTGRVVALISGGIDSPVAAWMMMRRGCRVIGVHFQNITGRQQGVHHKIE